MPAIPSRIAGSKTAVAALVLAGLAAGAAAHLVGRPSLAHGLWAVTTAAALVPLAVGIARDLLAGKAGVDLIALLAMAGALALGEPLAGAVVALMLSGGELLEEHAGSRARRELSALVERAPRSARLLPREGAAGGEAGSGRAPVEVPVEEVRPGDRLLLRPGEVVPVDARVASPGAVFDESALTGEARPVEHPEGERVASGVVNAGGPCELVALATAEESTYAGILRLVAEAERSRAPLVRLADRYALAFLPATLLVAGAAWALSGEPVRALAVLVVATPCPLILAAPIAIVAGVSRAARRGVVVKGGGPLEVLGRADLLYLDKTGTVTAGRPELVDVLLLGERGAELGEEEVLRLAASLETVSPHIAAEAVVRAARRRGLGLAVPGASREEAGEGLSGEVEGRRVRLGKPGWVLAGISREAPSPGGSGRGEGEETAEAPTERVASLTVSGQEGSWAVATAATGNPALPEAARERLAADAREGSSTVLVALDGEPAALFTLVDPLRPEARGTLEALRRLGLGEVVLLTGDDADIAERVGERLGIDRVLAERSPAGKVEAVREAAARGVVLMVGDGLNDAPALAVADIGVAMGARGATASSEAAQVVLVADELSRLGDAVAIARRSRRLALQSIGLGMALSGVGMVAAAFGYLTPVAGALVQEGIDVAAILNALRALRGPRGSTEQTRVSRATRARP